MGNRSRRNRLAHQPRADDTDAADALMTRSIAGSMSPCAVLLHQLSMMIVAASIGIGTAGRFAIGFRCHIISC